MHSQACDAADLRIKIGACNDENCRLSIFSKKCSPTATGRERPAASHDQLREPAIGPIRSGLAGGRRRGKRIFGFRNFNYTIWFEETLQPGVLFDAFDKPEKCGYPTRKPGAFASRVEWLGLLICPSGGFLTGLSSLIS